eukprot:gnl/Chilomastix_cuspidata/1999.p1 GENE.gnl/Chilomastix_cuspidata/1999~~gnl/Chilomastix_cuspidata/1999.p1  ORF type:complete len:174 (-),score=82.66 gnl/Chilomastix_cuspidata/1999:530-1051(-)
MSSDMSTKARDKALSEIRLYEFSAFSAFVRALRCNEDMFEEKLALVPELAEALNIPHERVIKELDKVFTDKHLQSLAPFGAKGKAPRNAVPVGTILGGHGVARAPRVPPAYLPLLKRPIFSAAAQRGHDALLERVLKLEDTTDPATRSELLRLRDDIEKEMKRVAAAMCDDAT